MSWSFRKSLRLLPGIRITLSKSGPHLSVGVPGVRASVDMRGNPRLSAGAGPIRYQKSVILGSVRGAIVLAGGLPSWVRTMFTAQ
jgi:hypothetical protein